MPMRIELINSAHPGNTFRSGSRIIGQVHVPIESASIAAQDSIPRIILWWSCSSVIRFERQIWILSNAMFNRTFPSKATLFRHKHVLTERDFAPAASRRGEDGGILVFPFEIDVPAFAEPVVTAPSARRTSTNPADTAQPHSNEDIYPAYDPWPASMTYNSGTAPQRLPDSSAQGFFYIASTTLKMEGSVEHTLYAELPNSSRDLVAEERIMVINRIPELTATEAMSWVSRQCDLEVRSPLLLDNTSGRRLSLKDRLSLAFSGAQIPSKTLTLEAQTKQALYLDAPVDEHLPFRLLVAWKEVRSREVNGTQVEDPPLPEVYLKRLTISIQGHIAARMNPLVKIDYAPHSGDAYDQREIFSWKENLKSSEREELTPQTWYHIGPRLGATHDLLRSRNEKHSRVHRPMGLVPSFRVPNLIRDYSLVWDVTLECAGVDIGWTCGGNREIGLPVVIEGGSGPIDDGDFLPAYESAA